MNYLVITADGWAFGVYEDYAFAYLAATINLGMTGWTITNI